MRWDALQDAPCVGFAGLLQRAGSRPGGRVTFLFDDKKVTKETSFELGASDLSTGRTGRLVWALCGR